MPRFFVDKNNIEENRILICGADAHHIARSLRMAEGDEAVVCDGSSSEYRCNLTRIRDEECECQIIETVKSEAESPVRITLCMAYPKGDKLETVIQKAVELGCDKIVPFESSRCIKRPKAEKAEKQTARLQRIAEEAAKQCGRARIPLVTQPMSFKQMLEEAKQSDLSLICYENEDGFSIKDALKNEKSVSSIAIIVGAEGGFAQDEIVLACEAGAKSITLGKRILRCETAPLFALTAICYELEL